MAQQLLPWQHVEENQSWKSAELHPRTGHVIQQTSTSQRSYKAYIIRHPQQNLRHGLEKKNGRRTKWNIKPNWYLTNCERTLNNNYIFGGNYGTLYI